MNICIYIYAIIGGFLMFVLLELDKKFIRNKINALKCNYDNY
jgi:hypothetical protein